MLTFREATRYLQNPMVDPLLLQPGMGLLSQQRRLCTFSRPVSYGYDGTHIRRLLTGLDLKMVDHA